MPLFPPHVPLHGRSDCARGAFSRRSVRRLGRGIALGLSGAGCLLLSAQAGQADPSTESADAAPAVFITDEDPAAISDVLSDWFARLDHSIRTVTTATDRAASRALEGGLGALAIGQDRRLSDQADTALANAPDAARRHFELASVGAPPSDAVRRTARSSEKDTDREVEAPIQTGSEPVGPAAPAHD